MTFDDIRRVNANLKTVPIKGKDYVEVNQRILAFRELYPEGFIRTTMLSNENGVCVFKAEVGTSLETADGCKMNTVLATGTAYEKETSSYINKTSYIENCETSAVGRALGMLGIGIDTSVASAEEVGNAIEQQNKKTEEAQQKIMAQEQGDKPVSAAEVKKLEKLLYDYQGEDSYAVRLDKVCKKYGVNSLSELKKSQYVHLCGGLTK